MTMGADNDQISAERFSVFQDDSLWRAGEDFRRDLHTSSLSALAKSCGRILNRAAGTFPLNLL